MPRDTAGQSHVGMFERVTDSKGVTRSPRSGVGDDITYDDGTKACDMRMTGDELSMHAAYKSQVGTAYSDMADMTSEEQDAPAPTPRSALKTPSPPRASAFMPAAHPGTAPPASLGTKRSR